MTAVLAFAPATALAAKTCAGKKATLVGTSGNDLLVGQGRDVIIAGTGDDKVLGLGGNDVVCGGSGSDAIYGDRGIDRIYGGDGDDRLLGQQGTDFLRGDGGDDFTEGGQGTDYLWGDGDDDTILGDRGSDEIEGGTGTDELLGGAGNDRLSSGGGERDFLLGGSGDDRLDGGTGSSDHVYGGLGADRLSGGPGDFDLVRGDDGFDLMEGGGGQDDIVSFATANPPGAAAFHLNGVYVDLSRGIAYGDGFGLGNTHGIDRLRRVDHVIGSPFDDRIVGDGRDNQVEGGLGVNAISGTGGSHEHRRTRLDSAAPPPPRERAFVAFVGSLDDYSAVNVIGADGPDRIEVSYRGSGMEIRNPAGLTTDPAESLPEGTGCTLRAEGTVATCSSPGGIDTLAINSGGGDDTVDVDGSVPRTLAGYLNGGDGNDTVDGGPEDDFIQGGPTGWDVLNGGSGDDSVQSDSGGDDLNGEAGDDLLVVSYPCSGETLRGGPGEDRVGFAPARASVTAWIGGSIVTGEGCEAGQISADVENLEGSSFADTLAGDGTPNSLLGRKGDDVLRGGGGSDELDGELGRDRCDGGAGSDSGASCEARGTIP